MLLFFLGFFLREKSEPSKPTIELVIYLKASIGRFIYQKPTKKYFRPHNGQNFLQLFEYLVCSIRYHCLVYSSYTRKQSQQNRTKLYIAKSYLKVYRYNTYGIYRYSTCNVYLFCTQNVLADHLYQTDQLVKFIL